MKNLKNDENNSTCLEYLFPIGQNEPSENYNVLTQPLPQRGRGRPRKVKTGRRGRPALEFNTVPVVEDENTDSNQESEDIIEIEEEDDNLGDDEEKILL